MEVEEKRKERMWNVKKWRYRMRQRTERRMGKEEEEHVRKSELEERRELDAEVMGKLRGREPRYELR